MPQYTVLPLCFLLADGRFQPFEAVRLELQFEADDELRTWALELWQVCGEGPMPDFGCSQVDPSGPFGSLPAGMGPALNGALTQPAALGLSLGSSMMSHGVGVGKRPELS